MSDIYTDLIDALLFSYVTTGITIVSETYDFFDDYEFAYVISFESFPRKRLVETLQVINVAYLLKFAELVP